jgi:AcrR family transcriptional regulator
VPKVVDREQRRQEVLEATSRVIGHRGIGGATFREIASELHTSTGTLNHYFRDKDDLLLAALRHCAQCAEERMREVVGRHRGTAAIRALLLEELPLDEQRRQEWAVWLAFWACGVVEPEYREEHRRRYVDWHAVLVAVLRAARDAGELPPDLDDGAEATRLMALVDGLGLRALLEPDTFPRERVEALIDDELDRLGRATDRAVDPG